MPTADPVPPDSPPQAPASGPQSVAPGSPLWCAIVDEQPNRELLEPGGEPAALYLLGVGHRLKLWRYDHLLPDGGGYAVTINNRQRVLKPGEVGGWVLGVLDAYGLPLGPFRHRQGL